MDRKLAPSKFLVHEDPFTMGQAMRDTTQIPDQDRVIEDIEEKQRNTIWPDATINSKGVDEFLWKVT